MNVANGEASMYIALSFKENIIIGNKNPRDVKYFVRFSFFPGFYEDYNGEGSKDHDEFVLKVVDWFEKNLLKSYEWEKQIYP